MVNILRNLKKVTKINFYNYVFLLTKNRYFVITAFKMLKLELKLEAYKISKERVNHFS